MDTIREEVREWVNVFERIHNALQDDQLSHDEKELIGMCASELIASMSARNHSATGGHLRVFP